MHHLDVVAGGVLRREETEARTSGAPDRVDMAIEVGAVGINCALGFLTRMHLLELRFLEVRCDPEVVEVDDRDEGLSGLYDLAGLNSAFAHDAGEGRTNSGVLQIELCLFKRRLRSLRGVLSRAGFSLLHLHLLR